MGRRVAGGENIPFINQLGGIRVNAIPVLWKGTSRPRNPSSLRLAHEPVPLPARITKAIASFVSNLKGPADSLLAFG